MSTRSIWCLLTITYVITFIHASDVKPGAPPPASVPKGHLPLGLVKLHPPANITAGYVGMSNIYIFWYEPENYHLSIPIYMNITINETETMKSDTNVSKDNAPPGYHVVTSKPEMETSTKTAKNVSISDWMGHEWVPFHRAHLIGYAVNWKENGSATNNTRLLQVNATELHLKGLKPGTTYQISVVARYASHTLMKSEDLYVTTLQLLNDTSDPDPGCFCDPYGVQEGGKKCHHIRQSPGLTVPLCRCRSGYTGLFCERCQNTYFRTAKNHPCYTCPCNKTVSSGICEFREDKLTCLHCNLGYGGKHCERCASGYFRLSSDEPCRRCYCSGKSEFCDQRSGFCMFCQDNTTGYSCDRCLAGFIGDPRKNQPCIHKDKIKATSIHTGGIVAGVCIGLLVLIGGIVGFVLYRRWNKFPNANKFWTVELKDDHERVNFSALPEDEVQARRMDYDFYQDQGGTRSKDGSQKYSHLQEI